MVDGYGAVYFFGARVSLRLMGCWYLKRVVTGECFEYGYVVFTILVVGCAYPKTRLVPAVGTKASLLARLVGVDVSREPGCSLIGRGGGRVLEGCIGSA